MEIRDVVDSDWAAVWELLQQIVAAGDTYCWPPDTSEDAGTNVVDGQARRSGVSRCRRRCSRRDRRAASQSASCWQSCRQCRFHGVTDGIQQGRRTCPGAARPRGGCGGWVRGDAVQRCRGDQRARNPAVGVAAASRFSPPSRTPSDILSVDLSGFTSCTGSCDRAPLGKHAAVLGRSNRQRPPLA